MTCTYPYHHLYGNTCPSCKGRNHENLKLIAFLQTKMLVLSILEFWMAFIKRS
jgi:hypothetical protein